jgi:hypothetical protein
VVRNYWHAIRFWRRNRARFGADPIAHSPIYGRGLPPPRRPMFLRRNLLGQLLRLAGENPFVFVLPLATAAVPPWGTQLSVWAVALTALAMIATVLPPLGAFGPGRTYLKTAVFPTAYTLAVEVGTPRGFRRPIGVATLAAVALSAIAIAVFYVYMRRQRTDRSADIPDGLAAAADHLAVQKEDGVFCLPYNYADFTSYRSGKKVLWGGHCGDLTRLEQVAPVITRPLPELFEDYGIHFVLLDAQYVTPDRLALDGRLALEGRWGTFELYSVRRVDGEILSPR